MTDPFEGPREDPMDPLSAVGVWALSLVGIAALVSARKAGAVHDVWHDDDLH